MTCTEEYQERIEYTFHAFCKVVIRNDMYTALRTRSRKNKREISLDYLTEEKHYPLGTEDEYFIVGETLAMADHTLLDPSWFAYDTPGLWNNYTHNGLLYLYTPDGEQKSRWIQMIRDKKPDQVEAGCSECRQGILLRVLGKSGDAVYDYFEDIAREV